MGINKQFRVSFDVTATMSHEQEAEFQAALVELAKGPRDPRQDHILIQALTHGPEGAFAAVLKDGLRDALHELAGEISCDELAVRFGPAEVRVKS